MEKNIFFGFSLRLLRHTHHPSLSHFYPPLTARCHLFFFPRLYCLLLSSIRAAMYSTIHPTHLIPLNNINDSSLHLNKIPVSLITTASEASCFEYQQTHGSALCWRVWWQKHFNNEKRKRHDACKDRLQEPHKNAEEEEDDERFLECFLLNMKDSAWKWSPGSSCALLLHLATLYRLKRSI